MRWTCWAARIRERIVVVEDCWIYEARPTTKGYTRVQVARTRHAAHRFMYELLAGPIPPGLQLDHLCRVRACVNPAHLEPVTNQENKQRSTVLIVACPRGHPYDEANTYRNPGGKRICRTCRKRGTS